MKLNFACLILFSTFAAILATDPAVPQCAVSNITIQLITPGIGLTYDDIKAHLEQEDMGFTDPLDSIFSCVDGRSTVAIVGTPGGDSGEFLLALSLYNKYAHPITTDDQVLEILKAFIENAHAHRSFYMHTDSHALDHLAADFAILNPGVKLNISNVPAAYQSSVFSLLNDSNNIGCGHLRNVLTHPDQYEVPASLTASFIRTFYNYLWNHGSWDDLALHQEDLTVLEGEHQEQAVLNVIGIVNDNDPCASYIPSVVPDNKQNDLFVNHPIAVGLFRASLAEFFSTLPDAPNAIVFKNYMDTLASKQLGLTLGYLAPGKPIYQVNITYAAVSTPATTGVNNVYDNSRGNASAAIASVLVGIFVVIAGSTLAYFGYQKFYAPKPVVKKPSAAAKKAENAQVELETIDTTQRNVDLEDV